MADLFWRQDEARDYASGIADRSERVWVEYVVSLAIGRLVRDDDYRATYENRPFDLFVLAKVAHATFQDRDMVEMILSGRYEHLSDIPDRS
jgi:hypothetical protein